MLLDVIGIRSAHVLGVSAPGCVVLQGSLPAACCDGEQGCGAQGGSGGGADLHVLSLGLKSGGVQPGSGWRHHHRRAL